MFCFRILAQASPKAERSGLDLSPVTVLFVVLETSRSFTALRALNKPT